MTPLAGLNETTQYRISRRTRTPDALLGAESFGQTAVPPQRAAHAAFSRGGSAMGTYRTRTGPMVYRRRDVLHKGEPWDSWTISRS